MRTKTRLQREKQKAEANFEVERAKLLNEIALEKAKNETTEHRLQAAFDAQHARLLKEHAIELHATRAELDKVFIHSYAGRVTVGSCGNASQEGPY